MIKTIFTAILRCYLSFYSVDICNGGGKATVGKPAVIEPHCTSSHCLLPHTSSKTVPRLLVDVFGEVDNFIKSKPCLICVMMWEMCRSASAY